MNALDPRALEAAKEAVKIRGAVRMDIDRTFTLEEVAEHAISSYLAATQPQAGEPVAVGYVDPADTARKSSVGEPLRFWCSPVKTTCFSMPLYASPQPANPAQVTDAIRGIVDDALNSAIPEPWEVAEHATQRILAAIGAGGQAVANDDGSMTPEEIRLENLKQMAAYDGPIVSFECREPYYLASCDHCGWVGSSELCGTDNWGDDSDVYCPRCHTSGADCGKVASALSQPHPADERVVEALREAEETLQLVEHPAFPDPVHHEEVKRLGRRIGFGALMSTASAAWRECLAADGDPIGGEFVAGPCHSSIVRALSIVREALAAKEGR